MNKVLDKVFMVAFLSMGVLLMVFFTACTDDEETYSKTPRKGVVTLMLPGVLSRADDTVTNDEYIPVGENTDSEGGINVEKGLWFFAFPTEYGKGKMLRQQILPKDLVNSDNNHKTFYVELEYGTYHFYLVGNVSDMQSIRTEEELKGHVINYNSTTDLTPGNLPMYREGVVVTIGENVKNENIDMHLTFLCSKVSIKVNCEGDESVQSLSVSQIAAASLVDAALCKAYEPEYIADSQEISSTDNTATFYVPEYYVKRDNYTLLDIKINNQTYTLPLGGEAYTSLKSSEVTGGNLVRGTHYDITATLPQQSEEWQLTVNNYEWSTQTLNTAFMETELWVEETVATTTVAPFVQSEIRYKTNAANPTATCITTIDDKPILIPTFPTKEDGETVVCLSFNPKLTYQDFKDKYNGTAEVCIKANNLTKVIKVPYSMYEVFEVTPLSITLNKVGETGEYICRSNIGEPVISNEKDETGESDNYSLSNVAQQKDGTYKITVTAKKMPTEGSITHNFTLTANGNKTRIKNSENLSVTLLPSGYVVHFAAINSFLKKESCHKLPFCDGYNEAMSNANDNSDADYPQTLIQRKDSKEGLSDKSWSKVKATINNTEKDMTVRNNTNPLWYDLALEENADSQGAPIGFTGNAVGTDYKLYAGGFYATRKELNAKDTPIRFPYGQNNQLTLFSHANKEGWIVADPTTLKVEWLTEEPTIVTVQYIVDVVCPSGEQAIGMRWYMNYGQINSNLGQFLIQSEQDTNGAYTAIKARKVTDDDNKYRFIFYLESTAKNTAKDINLMVRTQTGTIELGKLFGGQDFQNGSYENAYDPMTGYDDATSIVASGTYNCQTGLWSEGITGEEGDAVTAASDFKLGELEKKDEFFRIYFYRPMEPAAWNMSGGPYYLYNNNNNSTVKIEDGDATNVYIHMSINNWGDNSIHEKQNNLKLLPYNYREGIAKDVKQQERWHFIDMNDGNWCNYDVKYNTSINLAQIDYYKSKGYDNGPSGTDWAEFLAMFRNDTWNSDDDQSTDDGIGYVYKSDMWAWGNAYNNYFPDFRINGHDGNGNQYSHIGNNKALYYMDRKVFNQRPR